MLFRFIRHRNITVSARHHAGLGLRLLYEEGDSRQDAENAIRIRQWGDGGGQRRAIISMPMHAEGNSRMKSFLIGTLSGVVEPFGAVAILLLASVLGVALPYLLAFAAGAMMYVVVEELIPETAQGIHTNLSTIGFAVGFVLMMVMDVVLG